MEKSTGLMTPRTREKLLNEMREEELIREHSCYSWEVVNQRPRFASSDIPLDLFESFGVR